MGDSSPSASTELILLGLHVSWRLDRHAHVADLAGGSGSDLQRSDDPAVRAIGVGRAGSCAAYGSASSDAFHLIGWDLLSFFRLICSRRCGRYPQSFRHCTRVIGHDRAPLHRAPLVLGTRRRFRTGATDAPPADTLRQPRLRRRIIIVSLARWRSRSSARATLPERILPVVGSTALSGTSPNSTHRIPPQLGTVGSD